MPEPAAALPTDERPEPRVVDTPEEAPTTETLESEVPKTVTPAGAVPADVIVAWAAARTDAAPTADPETAWTTRAAPDAAAAAAPDAAL